MTRTIKLHHFAFAALVASLTSACLPKLDGLEAGLDDDDTSDTNGAEQQLECLIGTEIDALGTEQSSWSPGCAVVCNEGWGHDGEQLEIVWTEGPDTHEPGPASQARAIGLLANGRIIVASSSEGAVFLNFFEPDGLNIGGFDAAGLRSRIFRVEIDSHVVYVTHGNYGDEGSEDETVVLTAISIDSQQELWHRDFEGSWGLGVTRAGGRLAFLLRGELEDTQKLVVLDLDGEPLWTVDTPLSNGVSAAFSPSGERVAVAGDPTRVYAADDGELLGEFVHTALPIFYPQAVVFVGEDQVISAGGGTNDERMEGWLASDSLLGDDSWELTYNRADAWCPDEDDNDVSAATAEWLTRITALADGSLMVVGTESYEGQPAYFDGPPDESVGSHPWVGVFSPTGEFLASDRGLWDGYGADTIAGPDGSAFVLTVRNAPAEASAGFRVRKYLP